MATPPIGWTAPAPTEQLELVPAATEPATPEAATEKAAPKPIPTVGHPSSPLTIEHRAHGGGKVESTLKHRYVPVELIRRSSEMFGELVHTHLLTKSISLPEISAWYAIRGKSDGVADELSRIDLELQTIDLDRKKAVLHKEGADLASTLARLESQREHLTKKIAEVKRGGELFQADVAKSRQEAVEALQAFLKVMVPILGLEVRKTVDAAIENVFAELHKGTAAALAHHHVVLLAAGKFYRGTATLETMLLQILDGPAPDDLSADVAAPTPDAGLTPPAGDGAESDAKPRPKRTRRSAPAVAPTVETTAENEDEGDWDQFTAAEDPGTPAETPPAADGVKEQ